MKTTLHDKQTITTHNDSGDRLWRLQPDGRWMWDRSAEYDVEGLEGHTGHQLYLDLSVGEVERVYTEAGCESRTILPETWHVTTNAILRALAEQAAA